MECKYMTSFSYVDDKGNFKQLFNVTVYLNGMDSSFKYFTESLHRIALAAMDAIEDTKTEED